MWRRIAPLGVLVLALPCPAGDPEEAEVLKPVTRSAQVRAVQLMKRFDRSGDGLLDSRERSSVDGLDPASCDLSGDGLLSATELAYFLSRSKGAGNNRRHTSGQVHASQGAADGYFEALAHTIVRRVDVDRDGVLSRAELDGDGVPHHFFFQSIQSGATFQSVLGSLRKCVEKSSFGQAKLESDAVERPPRGELKRQDGFFVLRTVDGIQCKAAAAIVRWDANSSGTLGVLEYLRMEMMAGEPVSIPKFVGMDLDRSLSLSLQEVLWYFKRMRAGE